MEQPHGSTSKTAHASDAFGAPVIQPEEIQLIRVLGRGAFGTVWHGRCRAADVAVKVPNAGRKLNPRQLEAFKSEVKIMSKLYHPNVALFMGVCTPNPEQIMIVSELLQGDVESLLMDKSKELSLYKRMRMAKGAAMGITWLHGMDPVCLHRDFKTSNLLIDRNETVKVCDFGLSQLFDKGTGLSDAHGRPKGTPLYMAPEVWKGQIFNEKADVYSFGIVLWELLVREPAFSHHTSLDEFRKAITVDNERPTIPNGCLPSLAALMGRCWDPDPNRRPNFTEIVDALKVIMIDSCISDDLGNKLWKEKFLDREEVDWQTFVQAFYELLTIPLPVDSHPTSLTTDINLLNLRCLKTLLMTKHHENEDVVTIRRFGEILGWFGPIVVPSLAGDSILDRIRHLLGATMSGEYWFHGYLGLEEAGEKLRPCPVGSFLVRFSSNADHPTWFALSKVSEDKKVKSIRVEHEPGSNYIIRFGQHVYTYPSIQKVISDASFLRLSKPCPDSPYRNLFIATDVEICGYDLQSPFAQSSAT